ncbi:MAG: GNAT family N-acetyltransferase [Bacteroidales bacterium]|nr:GNAT family N-acetyltransferase [Bacteroidales bacterium]
MKNEISTIFSNQEIRLTRLSEEKIELVRYWRNQKEIQQFMEYREYISEKMQRDWFRKINNENNYYFILSVDNEDIGLMNIKNIDYQKKNGEKGSLIWNPKYRNKGIGKIANVLLIKFAFEELKLEYLYIHILEGNIRSQMLNLKFGFELVKNQENIQNKLYILNKENFYKL